MKLNFKILCAVGALLCMGSVYAGDKPLISANPFSEKSNSVSMTWKEFQNTAIEDLPESIVIYSWYISLKSSNIDRLLKVKDRISFLERYDLYVNAKDCEREKLITVLSNVFFKQKEQIDSLSLSNFEGIGFPKEIWNLTSLKELSLPNTQITTLPKEIWNLTNLKELSLPDAQITTLPKEIRNLKNLEVLNLLYNKSLIDLPKEIEALPNLDRVILNSSCDLSVRRFLTKKNHTATRLGITILHFEEDDFDYVESLDLSNKDLNRVPCDIVRLKDLKRLSLSNNNLESIPLFLRNVKKLESLDISKNNIASLPTEIWPFPRTVKNLEILDISHNNIASLPTEIWSFPRTLKYLTIDGFLLKNIPDDRIESIANIHGVGEGGVSRRGVLDLIAAKANHLPSGNKQMLQSLGGICTVKLKEPPEKKPSLENNPSRTETRKVQ